MSSEDETIETNRVAGDIRLILSEDDAVLKARLVRFLKTQLGPEEFKALLEQYGLPEE